MRKATEIKDNNLINYLLNLTEDDCLTLSKMLDLLGDFGEGDVGPVWRGRSEGVGDQQEME